MTDATHVKNRPFVLPLPTDGSYTRLLSPAEGEPGMHSGLVTLEPGDECGEHTTGAHEEMIVVLSGHGEIDAEGAGTAEIAANFIAYNPPHTRHNVRNTGDEPLRYVYIVAPREA